MQQKFWQNVLAPLGSFRDDLVEAVKAVIDIFVYWWEMCCCRLVIYRRVNRS